MNINQTLFRRNAAAAMLAGSICSFAAGARADTSFTINDTTADAYVASGSAANPLGTNLSALNFGGAGTLAISPASSAKGEYDSVIKFNTAGAINQFNTTYGSGNWQITGLTLQLSSNFATQGQQPNNMAFNTINTGSFGIDWLATDNWVEGGGTGTGEAGYPSNSELSLQAIPALLAGGTNSLGTFTYTPPGNSSYVNYALPLNVNLVSNTITGGDVSLYFYAADNQVGYLFNSRTFGSGHPEFTLTAAQTPEPGVAAVGLTGLAVVAARFRKR